LAVAQNKRPTVTLPDPSQHPASTPLSAVERNGKQRQEKFAPANGQRWLAECRDLGDANDHDAGVYFQACPDDATVDSIVACFTDDNAFDRLLGVVDVRQPLAGPGGGLTRAQWLAR
jgi:hypothetical protein